MIQSPLFRTLTHTYNEGSWKSWIRWTLVRKFIYPVFSYPCRESSPVFRGAKLICSRKLKRCRFGVGSSGFGRGFTLMHAGGKGVLGSDIIGHIYHDYHFK